MKSKLLITVFEKRPKSNLPIDHPNLNCNNSKGDRLN